MPSWSGDGRAAGAAGFTLVEVLVALLVMAVMAGMAWRGVDGIVRTRDASQTRLDQTLRINTVIAQWEQDLLALQDSTALPQSLSCDGATVRLSRHTPTGMQVVAWSLRPNPEGATWVRWAGPSVTTTTDLQQSWQASLQLQDDDAGAVRTLTGLQQWQVYFYQGNGWANCQSTGDLLTAQAVPVQVAPVQGAPVQAVGSASGPPSGTTPPTPPTTPTTALPPRQALPAGVRIVLSFAPGSGLTGELTRDVALGP